MAMEQYTPTVVLASSGHSVDDDLIVHRYAVSIAQAGMHVVVIACGQMRRTGKDAVDLVGLGVGPRHGWLSRLLWYDWRVWYVILRNRPDVLIIHTPDLLVGSMFFRLAKRVPVIYNAQENWRVKLGDRGRVTAAAGRLLANVELLLSRRTDAIVVTDEASAKAYPTERCVVLPNYPRLDQWLGDDSPAGSNPVDTLVKEHQIRLVYAGTISFNRGLFMFDSLLDALPPSYSIHLYGTLAPIDDHYLQRGDGRLAYHGQVPFAEMPRVLKQYDGGLCLFRDIPAYRYYGENTTKLFEYMAAGLPVIASDFPGLRHIVERAACGICVPVNDATCAAESVKALFEEPGRANACGSAGRHAFRTSFNWEGCSRRLVELVLALASRGMDQDADSLDSREHERL